MKKLLTLHMILLHIYHSSITRIALNVTMGNGIERIGNGESPSPKLFSSNLPEIPQNLSVVEQAAVVIGTQYVSQEAGRILGNRSQDHRDVPEGWRFTIQKKSALANTEFADANMVILQARTAYTPAGNGWMRSNSTLTEYVFYPDDAVKITTKSSERMRGAGMGRMEFDPEIGSGSFNQHVTRTHPDDLDLLLKALKDL